LSEKRKPVSTESIRIVRTGHGANCSSIGSVIDTLFVTALAGGAVFAAICAALDDEPVHVAVTDPPPTEPGASPPVEPGEGPGAS
jgi:hypothetical protein